MSRNAYKGSYVPRAVTNPQSQKDEDSGGGLFGLGFGPDLNIGAGTALRELGEGVTALVGGVGSLLTPGKDGPGAAEFGSALAKGIGSSVIGTAETAIPGDFLSDATAAVLGEEYRPKDFAEKATERGILPALVEDVGNVALVGGLATAPVKGASVAAKLTGFKSTSARLNAVHKNLITKPLIQAAQHPYRTSARAIRSKMNDAKVLRDAELGLGLLDDAADAAQATQQQPVAAAAATTQASPAAQLAGDLDAPDALTPDAPTPDAPQTNVLQRGMARAETYLQSRENALRKAREGSRIAEMARRTINRSEAMQVSTRIAREHILDKAGDKGLQITRSMADHMVGEAITHRITGVKALIDEALDQGTPESVLKEAGVIENPIPAQLMTPELDAALTQAVDAWIVEADATKQILLNSRKGDEGLAAALEDPDGVTLTRAQQKRLTRARRALERAEKKNAQILKQRESAGNRMTAIRDRIGRTANEIGDIDRRLASQLEAFDHTRYWVPKPWRTRQGLQQSLQAIHEATIRDGGSTFDPHQGRFLELGGDEGYMVAVRNKTILEVPVDEFTPDHIQQVVDAYGELFMNDSVTVGTWIDEGTVHIDLSERVMDLDEALIKAGARQQLAITDMAKGTFPGVPLRDRPDIAAAFLDRNRQLKKVGRQLRDLADENGWDVEDAYAMQGLLMRQAVTATDLGQVKHPDDFFRQFDIKKASRQSTADGVLRQMVKRFDPTDPAQQDVLWAETQKILPNLEKSLKWYDRSHEAIERRLRKLPPVTLLDGKTQMNPADLAYELLGATSFNESPQGNLRITLDQMSAMFGPEADAARTRVQEALAKVSGGKGTLDDVLEAIAPDAPKKGPGREASPRTEAAEGGRFYNPDTDQYEGGMRAANVPLARQVAFTILSGKTFSPQPSTGWAGWTPEFVANEFRSAWGIEAELPKDLSLNESVPGLKEMVPKKTPALAEGGRYEFEYIQKNFPEFVERATQLAGEGATEAAVRNQAIREFYGSAMYTKVMSFWDNLANPETSQAVTLDMWMARLFGVTGFGQPGQWIKVAEGVREIARKVSEQTGTKVQPHAIQAALWVYVNKELSQQKAGHFLARAEEVRDVIDSGVPIADDLDPVQTWVDEFIEPYAKDAPSGFSDYERPIRRPNEPETRTETVSYRKEKAGTYRSEGEKHRKAWLKVRQNINALIEEGDLPRAQDLLDEYIAKTQKSLAGKMGGDANALDMADLLDDATPPAGFGRALDTFHARAADHGKPLLQAFGDEVLGEFVPATDTTRAAIRIFKDGNLATLVHENGHMLRRILPEGEMRAVEQAYGVKDGRWSVAAEERFANDFLKFMARPDRAPVGSALEGTFARVRTALKDIFDMVMRTFHRGKIDSEVADIFDRWLNPVEKAVDTPDSGAIGLDLPDMPESGTPAQIAARNVKYPDAATKGDHYAAGRKGAQHLAETERLAKRRRQLEATKKRLEKDFDELRETLENNLLPAEIEQRKYYGAAARMESKVHEQLGRPSVTNTPARWQPLYQAWHALSEYASETDPSIAGIMADAKDVLPQIQRLAMERGFNPSHVSQFSPAQVRRLVFGTMQLGLGKDVTEMAAGARKKRTGALTRAGGVEKSLSALMSAAVDATVEARTNAVIDHVEKTLARKIPEGTPIPDGWVQWSPTRTFLLTGKEVSQETGKAVATAAMDGYVIPKSAANMLRREVGDFNHPLFTAINKITSPWRSLVLTLSPGWYVRNIFGNVMMAEAEGVKLSDWKKAWQSYRNTDGMGNFADIPFVTTDTLAQEAGRLADDSVVPKAKGRQGFKEALTEGGRIRGAKDYAQQRLLRVNAVVDEFARAAVYHKGRRINMTKEQAWQRATDALVDYNNLSPFERQAVRSVIPFYAWQKGILKVTVNQALDHPARAAILQNLGKMQEEYVADLFGVDPVDVPDYYKHMGFGDRNLRGYNPFADPTEILEPEGIMRSMNPFLEIAVRKGLGAPEFFPDSYRLGAFGNAEADVNVPKELLRLGTSSPAGRVLGGEGGGPAQLLGVGTQDVDKIRSRILRSRKQIRGIPNPETSPTR